MVLFLNTSFATLSKDDQLEKKKILSQSLSYWPAMPQWLLFQGYLLGYSHPVGGQWSGLSHWMIYSRSRQQTLHWHTSGVDSLGLFWWIVGFECRRVEDFLKIFGFLMEEATFKAVYAVRKVRSSSSATTTTNISDNPSHKIHIQFTIWKSINFLLGCEIQLRFSWQIISKASVITGPRPFSARNWITAYRKLENCQVKRNILK